MNKKDITVESFLRFLALHHPEALTEKATVLLALEKAHETMRDICEGMGGEFFPGIKNKNDLRNATLLYWKTEKQRFPRNILLPKGRFVVPTYPEGGEQ